jgi:hypothetical protein
VSAQVPVSADSVTTVAAPEAAPAAVPRTWPPVARLLWLHLRSRRVPAAVAGLAACALTLGAGLNLHWFPGSSAAAAAEVPMLLEAAAAAIIVVTAHSPFGESEKATGWWLPVLRPVVALALCGAGIGLFAVAAAIGYDPARDVYLSGGILPVVQNILGFTAVGLLLSLASGGLLAWIGPLAWQAVCQFALIAHYTEPLTWAARPPGDRGGWVAAMVVVAAGLVAYTLRGPRIRPSGE